MTDSRPRRGNPDFDFSPKYERQSLAKCVGTRTDKKSGGSIGPFRTAIQIAIVGDDAFAGTPAADFAISRVVLTPSTKGMSSTRPPQARTSRAPTMLSWV